MESNIFHVHFKKTFILKLEKVPIVVSIPVFFFEF